MHQLGAYPIDAGHLLASNFTVGGVVTHLNTIQYSALVVSEKSHGSEWQVESKDMSEWTARQWLGSGPCLNMQHSERLMPSIAAYCISKTIRKTTSHVQ